MAKKKTDTSKAKSAKAPKKTAVKTKSAGAKKTSATKTVKKKVVAKKKNTAPKTAKKVVKKAVKKVAKPKTAAKKVAKKVAASKSAVAPVKARASKPPAAKKKLSLREAAMAAVSGDSETMEDKPMPKTRLTDDQLAMFKEMLLSKRRELQGDVRTLTKDALGLSRQESTGDLSSMPIHMADIGSDNWEQDFTLGLIANEQHLVREIDEALDRIDNRTYGVCVATHRPITIARLRAKPWAKYCIEYAREQELKR